MLLPCVTNSRFAAKVIAAAPSGAGNGAGGSAAAPEMVCIADEAGRLRVAGCSEQERGWVPRRELESWLCLMHEVGLLRVPLLFGRAYGSITLSEGGAVATKNAVSTVRTAASMVVMRSGRHFVQFTVLEGTLIMLGVIRPGWDVEEGMRAHLVDGHCFNHTGDGRRYPGNHDWKGKQPAEQGDRIGMLLDLDQGSMTVWKNDVKLGVMMAEGLSGPLCWAILLYRQGTSARIESAPLPNAVAQRSCPNCVSECVIMYRSSLLVYSRDNAPMPVITYSHSHSFLYMLPFARITVCRFQGFISAVSPQYFRNLSRNLWHTIVLLPFFWHP